VQLDIAPASIDGGAAFLPSAALMAALLRQRKLDPTNVRCTFSADPLGALMSGGELTVPFDVAFKQMADLAVWTATLYPKAAAIQIDTGAYHHAGATSTQDLAFAMATAVEYLRAITAAGLDVNTAAGQIGFSVSLGCQFFQGIAKLRAIRKLWAKIVTASGGNEAAARSTRIQVRTSRRVLTHRDPWVNLLRNTVCCFAGAVGGADSITTAPLDAAIGLSDEFSRHLARNTQIILLEESHLNRVIDPAGGSWFLESCTDRLAAEAWKLLQAIEDRGGMIQAVLDGWVAEQIRAIEAVREKNLATRKQIVTGLSDHTDAHEKPLSRPKPDFIRLRTEASARLITWRRDHPCSEAVAALTSVVADNSRAPGALTEAAVKAAEAGATLGQLSAVLASGSDRAKAARIESLAIHPYAAAYEELRNSSDQFATRTKKRPMTFLANMGKPVDFIARSTYALNFFQAGGFEVINNDGFNDPSAAAAAFVQSHCGIAVICSSDKKYEQVAEETARHLKSSGGRTVILAGNPGANEAKYRAAGIDRFIFVRCDVLNTLRELLHEEGVL
jgi:methylmalonyl-CoA mutase